MLLVSEDEAKACATVVWQAMSDAFTNETEKRPDPTEGAEPL